MSAHVAANDVSIDRLPVLIREVHRALVTAGQAPAEPNKAVPAVAVKKFIFADHILCLDCGGSFKTLKRHIATDHQMTPDEYRLKWSLSRDYPMVSVDYAAQRSKLANLGRTKTEAPPPPMKRGRPKKG